MMGRRNRSNHIPDGWQGCPSMGTGFIDDRFFVFKTPLKPDLNNKVPQSQRFSIEHVFQQVEQMNHSRIGLWIDLTNTARYYNPTQIVNQGILYEKLSCEGHGKPPSRHTISRFCNLVHHFFRTNRRDYVGVHCTHGFNRTGYLICCYLIQFRRYSAAEAVEEFSKHRQPGIYRQIYVNDLYNMSFPRVNPIQVTEPEWLSPHRHGLQLPPILLSASSSTASARGIPCNVETPASPPLKKGGGPETTEGSHKQPGSSAPALLPSTSSVKDNPQAASTPKSLLSIKAPS